MTKFAEMTKEEKMLLHRELFLETARLINSLPTDEAKAKWINEHLSLPKANAS